MAVSVGAVRNLLSPGSIALVGASETSMWTAGAVRNMEIHGYQGKLFLVNPKRTEIFGRPCYPSLSAIRKPVDLALIVVGAAQAVRAVEECAELGIRSVVVISSGFAESGPAGAELERRLVRLCREHSMALLGPNCLGYFNNLLGVPAGSVSGDAPIPKGHVAMVMQSGLLAMNARDLAITRNVGISHLITMGNAAVLNEVDYIRCLIEEPEVKVVAALLEGIRDPKGLAEVTLRALEIGKPIVVLKTGLSEAGARSAAAHTASLAGSRAVTEAYLRQYGMIQVGSLEELVETAGLLAAHGWPDGPRIGALSQSGGACTLFADLASGTAIQLPDFAPETRDRLKSLLTEWCVPNNPLDMTGQTVGNLELISQVTTAVAGDPNVDGVVLIGDSVIEAGHSAYLASVMKTEAEALKASGKFACIITQSVSELTPLGRQVAEEASLHVGNGLVFGVAAVDKAVRYGEFRRRFLAGRRERVECGSAMAADIARFRQSLLGRKGALNEREGKELLRAYGIPTPKERVVHDVGGAVAAAQEIGFPVVLKVVAADVPHKTEAGGVALNINTPEAVEAVYERILNSVRRYKPDARIDGMLVAEQVTGAQEMIAGITNDPVFGPVVLVGLGGIFVETLRDAAMRLPPFDKAEALQMLGELRGKAILEGARGRPAADVEALAETLVRLGSLAVDWQDQLAALDINPLFVLPQGKGVRAADSLVVLRDPETARGSADTTQRR